MNASSESGLWALTISRGARVILQESTSQFTRDGTERGGGDTENVKGGANSERRLEDCVTGHQICARAQRLSWRSVRPFAKSRAACPLPGAATALTKTRFYWRLLASI